MKTKNIMRNFFLLFYITFIVGGAANAQTFEGTIEWDIDTEIKNPNLKQDMEQSMKELQSPETQETIARMEEQLSDPAYQEKLNQNPEMKAMLERQLQQMKSMQKLGQEGGSFMPTHITVKVKGDKSVTNIEGGMGEMFGDILYLGDKNATYSVDDENKTYSLLPEESLSDSVKPEISKVGKGPEIMGYSTTKYKLVENDEKGNEVISEVWVTDEIDGLDPHVLSRASKNDYMGMFLKEVDGVPLKVKTASKDMEVTMEVVEINKENISASAFEIPSDYEETEMIWSRK